MGDDIFFLSIDEILALLGGDRGALAHGPGPAGDLRALHARCRPTRR